ncbi:MAG: hypothetical protein ABMA25_29785, partial [Ilumatobacteraceae bacterium]
DHGVALAPLLDSPALAQAAPALGVKHFVHAGAIVAIDENGDRLRVDVGGPAPAHQPAHAHGPVAGEVGRQLREVVVGHARSSLVMRGAGGR